MQTYTYKPHFYNWLTVQGRQPRGPPVDIIYPALA
jgi:hypothetical protein